MIIDSHVHMFYDFFDAKQAESAEEFLRKGLESFDRVLDVADAAGIDKLCLLGEPPKRLRANVPESIQEEIGLNGLLLHLLDKYPDRLFGYPRITPRDPSRAIREIERCFENKSVVGVKVGGTSGCSGSLKANAPEYEPIMKKLIELDGIMLMHAWNKTTGNYEQETTPFELTEMAAKFPEARIHMAHLNGANYDGILAVAPHKNIFVDTSGSYPEAGFLEWAVDVLGPERIVFGSDATGRDFCVQLAKVTGSRLDEGTKQMILGRNMLDILKACRRGG